MRLQSTFTNWDFNSVWGVQNSYPYLRNLTTYSLAYSAWSNGRVADGITTATALTQLVNVTTKGQPVKTLPNPGYVFKSWNDDSTRNPRTDVNVRKNHTIWAYFRSTRNNAESWLVYE